MATLASSKKGAFVLTTTSLNLTLAANYASSNYEATMERLSSHRGVNYWLNFEKKAKEEDKSIIKIMSLEREKIMSTLALSDFLQKFQASLKKSFAGNGFLDRLCKIANNKSTGVAAESVCIHAGPLGTAALSIAVAGTLIFFLLFTGISQETVLFALLLKGTILAVFLGNILHWGNEICSFIYSIPYPRIYYWPQLHFFYKRLL